MIDIFLIALFSEIVMTDYFITIFFFCTIKHIYPCHALFLGLLPNPVSYFLYLILVLQKSLLGYRVTNLDVDFHFSSYLNKIENY